MEFRSRLNTFFSKGHERSLQAKKNIAFSFLLKGFSIVLGLLIIPITIRYISPAQYGIWLTLSSLIGWMSFFDIGLGNGLRNKLAAFNAIGEYQEARVLISTTYAILIIISASLFVLFYPVSSWINWNKILNTGSSSYPYNEVALLVFGLFCIQFVVQILNTILMACHQVSKVSLVVVIGQVIAFVGIMLLVKFTKSSLLLLVLINGGAPVLTLFLASIWYYRTALKAYMPAVQFIDLRKSPALLGSGVVFFIIQIGALVLFQTDNIVIAQLFGPAQVTTFNIAYKLYSVFIMGFNIIIAPFWSAFTDAYTKGDLEWIKSVMLKMRYLWVLISVGAVILFFISPFIYNIWLGHAISVPVSLSLAMTLYIIAYTWQTIHVFFLNGINKIRLQLALVVLRIGLAGITLSNAFLFFLMGAIFYVQTKRILEQNATGIFNA
jgi:O-antigen/teichoic acid export membrane protein